MRKTRTVTAVLVSAVIMMAILAGLARATPSSATSFFLAAGRFTTVDVPGATATRLFAINDVGLRPWLHEKLENSTNSIHSSLEFVNLKEC